MRKQYRRFKRFKTNRKKLVTEKLIEIGSDSACDSKIRYFCKADELFEILVPEFYITLYILASDLNGQEVSKLTVGIETFYLSIIYLFFFFVMEFLVNFYYFENV